MQARDVSEIALKTWYDHDEFLVMPLRLTKAPMLFIMNHDCKPYLDEFVIGIIDDILIYSQDKEGPDQHLWLVLKLLK